MYFLKLMKYINFLQIIEITIIMNFCKTCSVGCTYFNVKIKIEKF